MSDDRWTEIGPQTLVRGDIEAREDIVILGRVEGDVTSTHTVTIEEGGVAQAHVRASRVVIAGVLLGQAEASERIEITPTGRVLGTLATPRLILEDGGAVQGDVVMDGSRLPAAQVPSGPVQGRTSASRGTATSGAASTRRATTATPAPRPGREPARPATLRTASPSRTAAPVRPARPVVTAPGPEPIAADDSED